MTISVSANNLTPQQQVVLSLQQEKVGGGAASFAAIGGALAASMVSTPISLGVVSGMQKMSQYDNDTIKKFHNAAKTIIKKNDLKKEGVSIKLIKQYSKDNLASLVEEITNPLEALKNGRNAFFLMKDAVDLKTKKVIFPKHTILAPEKDLSFALFHELGHAHNKIKSKLGSILQSVRTPGLYAPLLLAMYGACSRKSKPKEGEKLTGGQKVNNFIRNNAGKLSLLCMIPMLMEECMATVKGNKWAKELLSPDNAKKVAKGSWFAYTSYLVTVGSMVLASVLAVKIKDKIIDNKERKREELVNSILSGI